MEMEVEMDPQQQQQPNRLMSLLVENEGGMHFTIEFHKKLTQIWQTGHADDIMAAFPVNKLFEFVFGDSDDGPIRSTSLRVYDGERNVEVELKREVKFDDIQTVEYAYLIDGQRKEKKEYKEHIFALVGVFGRLTKDTLELFLNYDRAKKLHECLGVTNTAREVSAIAVQLQTLKNNILVQRKVLKMCGQRQENLNRMRTKGESFWIIANYVLAKRSAALLAAIPQFPPTRHEDVFELLENEKALKNAEMERLHTALSFISSKALDSPTDAEKLVEMQTMLRETLAGPREAQQMPDAHEAEYDRIHFQNELQALELLVARDIQFVPPQLNGPEVSRTLQKQQLGELDHTITSLELEIDMEERTRAARNDHKVAMNRLQTNIYKRRAAIMKNRLCANDDAQLFDKAVEDQGLQNRVIGRVIGLVRPIAPRFDVAITLVLGRFGSMILTVNENARDEVIKLIRREKLVELYFVNVISLPDYVRHMDITEYPHQHLSEARHRYRQLVSVIETDDEFLKNVIAVLTHNDIICDTEQQTEAAKAKYKQFRAISCSGIAYCNEHIEVISKRNALVGRTIGQFDKILPTFECFPYQIDIGIGIGATSQHELQGMQTKLKGLKGNRLTLKAELAVHNEDTVEPIAMRGPDPFAEDWDELRLNIFEDFMGDFQNFENSRVVAKKIESDRIQNKIFMLKGKEKWRAKNAACLEVIRADVVRTTRDVAKLREDYFQSRIHLLNEAHVKHQDYWKGTIERCAAAKKDSALEVKQAILQKRAEIFGVIIDHGQRSSPQDIFVTMPEVIQQRIGPNRDIRELEATVAGFERTYHKLGDQYGKVEDIQEALDSMANAARASIAQLNTALKATKNKLAQAEAIYNGELDAISVRANAIFRILAGDDPSIRLEYIRSGQPMLNNIVLAIQMDRGHLKSLRGNTRILAGIACLLTIAEMQNWPVIFMDTLELRLPTQIIERLVHFVAHMDSQAIFFNETSTICTDFAYNIYGCWHNYLDGLMCVRIP